MNLESVLAKMERYSAPLIWEETEKTTFGKGLQNCTVP